MTSEMLNLGHPLRPTVGITTEIDVPSIPKAIDYGIVELDTKIYAWSLDAGRIMSKCNIRLHDQRHLVPFLHLTLEQRPLDDS